MYLVRALNNLDILGNPLENGIASKQLIYRIVGTYYDKSNNKEYLNLNEEEKDIFIKEHMEEYLREHNNKIKNKYFKYSNNARYDVRKFCEFNRTVKSKSKEEINMLLRDNNKEGLDFGSYITFQNYLSTLQQHLLYGSSKMTDWISFSTDINAIMRYYDNQDIHKIAVVRSNTGGLVDSDYILSVDLSTMEKIKAKTCLCNKIDIDENIVDVISELATLDPQIAANFKYKLVSQTDVNSRGFKYANKSREVCILKYVPRDHIVSVLESLQIDLMKLQVFNQDFLKLDKEQQKKELETLKKGLEYEVIRQDDPYLKHIFDELYINNKNIKNLVSFNESKDKIKHNRNKVLYLAKHIPNIQIKR